MPDQGNLIGEDDYVSILLKILSFLKNSDDDTIPIFYVEGNPDIPSEAEKFSNTKRIIKLIFEQAGEYEVSSDLKVFPVVELFYFLYNKITERKKNPRNSSFPSISYAQSKFQATEYDFAFLSHLTCDYHYEKEAVDRCCLSKVRCFCYTIAKWCSQQELYPIKEGRHYPAKH